MIFFSRQGSINISMPSEVDYYAKYTYVTVISIKSQVSYPLKTVNPLIDTLINRVYTEVICLRTMYALFSIINNFDRIQCNFEIPEWEPLNIRVKFTCD